MASFGARKASGACCYGSCQCAGFRADLAFLPEAARPPAGSKYPETDAWYEAAATPGLFFLGALGHGPCETAADSRYLPERTFKISLSLSGRRGTTGSL